MDFRYSNGTTEVVPFPIFNGTTEVVLFLIFNGTTEVVLFRSFFETCHAWWDNSERERRHRSC
jgi:hypothetical protein